VTLRLRILIGAGLLMVLWVCVLDWAGCLR